MSQQEMRKNPMNNRTAIKESLDWLDSIVISILCIVLLFTFVFRLVGVEGTSMVDTLHDKDRVIIERLFYTPQRGDVVVISRADKINILGESEKPLIKRIIGVAGDEIRFDFPNGKVYINGEELIEDYIFDKTYNQGMIPCKNPFKVSEGHVFVMGDNRPVSKDSRTLEIGEIDTRYILGKAILRVYPFTDFKIIK